MNRKAHQVDITVEHVPRVASASRPTLSRSWLRRVARSGIQAALHSSEDSERSSKKSEGLAAGPVQMGLVIADDETLQRLNREYRGADEVTDVLSFSWDHEGHWEGDEEPPAGPEMDVAWPADATPTRDYHPLGEVIVSYPQAERQAQTRGADTEQELALLIVHGILHLAGFDHVEPEEEAQMKAKEEEALGRIWKK